MTFLEHLEELRKALIQASLFVALGMIAGWQASDWVLDRLIRNTIGSAVFLSPIEPFSARLKVAFLLGLLVSLPVVLWRVWRFVVPGLLARERTVVLPLVFVSCLLFYAGGAFSFFVLTPAMMRVLLEFGSDALRPSISVGIFLSLVIKIGLACGLLFQLPLVVSLLTWAGVVSPRPLLRSWRYAILIVVVASAILTPSPDVLSLLLLAAPTMILYFLSVGLSFLIAGGRKKRERSEERLSLPEGDHAPGR